MEPSPRATEHRPAPHRRPWRRLLRLALIVYLGVVAVFATLQTRLIFPGHATQGQPLADVRPGPGAELIRLRTPSGDRVVALFGPALDAEGRPLADAPSRPTILFFYGNGMCLADCADLFDRFRRLGANVLIPDYVGYGLSGGAPGEAGCVATADAAWDHLRERPDVDPDRIVAAGWSLGSAVAADLAARRPVAGLALFSAFTSMADMARRVVPFVPARLLLRHRFETERKLRSITSPTLIGHGRADTLIPFAMADRLAGAAAGPVSRFVVEGADHDAFFALGGPELDSALRRFLGSLDGR